MATLDSSIVNIALPTLSKTFSTDLYQVKWVVIGYLLVITCLLLPFGRLADQYGRKFVFQLGFLVFIIGSGLCSLSPTLTSLVLARILQGIGAAMLMANGPAILTAAFPSKQLGSALGLMAMVVSTGLISGPSVGGFLIIKLGWPSIFWINIPIGLAGIALVYRFVVADAAPKNKKPFDWAGAFLQMLFLIFFIVILDPPNISVSGSGEFPISRWVLAGITLAIGMLFMKVESEAPAPLCDFALLKNKTFWTANLAGFLTFVSFSSVSILMPFFLEKVLHFDPAGAGLFMTAIPLTIFVVAPISGRLSDHVGSQELSFAGALVLALGLFIMAGVFGHGLHEHISRAAVILILCSMGLATGLFQSPNNNAIMGSVPHDKLSLASALLATIRNLGLVTGTGLATGLFSWRMEVTGNFLSSLHFTHLIAGFIGVGAMIASLGKPRGPRREIA